MRTVPRSWKIRLLQQTLPATLLAAGFGYLLAYGAGLFLQVNTPVRPWLEPTEGQRTLAPPPDEIALQLKIRLPIVLAVGTAGLILILEGLIALRQQMSGIDSRPSPPGTNPTTTATRSAAVGPHGMDPEVEALFQAILAQGGGLSVTPPPLCRPETPPVASETSTASSSTSASRVAS